MLLVGMDVSGKGIDNYGYLAVVLGTTESVRALSNQIGSMRTHMSGLTKPEQESIRNRLAFDSKNRIAFCVTLKRSEILDKIESLRRVKRKRMPKGNIIRTYNRVVILKIKTIIEDFVLSHNESVVDLTIQCDSDCNPFAKIGDFSYAYKGDAHKISDIIAWCNKNNKTPNSVIEIDFTDEIPEKMMKILHFN